MKRNNSKSKWGTRYADEYIIYIHIYIIVTEMDDYYLGSYMEMGNYTTPRAKSDCKLLLLAYRNPYAFSKFPFALGTHR